MNHATVRITAVWVVGTALPVCTTDATLANGALHFLPDKKAGRELTGKEISIERESGKTKEVMKN